MSKKSPGFAARATVTITAVLSLVSVPTWSAQAAGLGVCRDLQAPTSADEKISNRAAGPGQLVRTKGSLEFPDIFGGTHSENNGNDLVIHVTKCDTGAINSLIETSGMDPSHVAVTLVKRTFADQNKVFEEVSHHSLDISKAGILLDAVMLDGVTGDTTVTLINPSPTDLQDTRSIIGRDDVNVLVSELKEQATLTDRNDGNGYYRGGSFLTGQQSYASGAPVPGTRTDCSLGATTRAGGGGTYLVTSAHCFPNDPARPPIRNGSALLNSGNFQSVGFVAQRDASYGGLDAELIFGTGSNSTWTGWTITSSFKQNVGVAGYQRGDGVCHSGAFEGEVCGFTSGDKGCKTFYEPPSQFQNYATSYYFCEVVTTTSSNPQAVGQGDSGGPVIKYYPNAQGGTDLRISGIVTGAVTPNKCSNYGDYPGTSNRKCGPNMFYTDFSPIQAKWGLILPA